MSTRWFDSWSAGLTCTQLTLCEPRVSLFFLKKYDKYSLNQKEKLTKLCLKYKLEADSSKEKHWDLKRKKFVANQQSFKSRTVQEGQK